MVKTGRGKCLMSRAGYIVYRLLVVTRGRDYIFHTVRESG